MLSQTTEYALRAMACLASTPETLTPTPQLARDTRVPGNYLAKVLQLLAQSGLIRGRRGVGGGYRLARPASAISMLDVVNAIAPLPRDERVRLAAEVADVPHLAALHARLDEATETVSQLFADVTLEQLVRGVGAGRTGEDDGRFSVAAGVLREPVAAGESPRF